VQCTRPVSYVLRFTHYVLSKVYSKSSHIASLTIGKTACFALNSPGMRRFVWFCLAVGLLMAAAACSGPGGDLRGATPAGYIRPVANPLTDATAEVVTIADLLEEPEMYEGQLLEINGIYHQRRVVVCSSRPQYSPARWSLSDGEERVPVGGVGENFENLPSGRIEIAVTGRWLRWQGPVGCGRQAQVTEIWYLDVLEILSPNPITLAAAGPETSEVSIELEPPGLPPLSEGGYPGPGTESDEPQITATLPFSGTPVLSPPTPSPTAAGPNPTTTPTLQNVTTPTTAAYPPADNVTPSATSAAATPSPTTTNGGPPPPPTSTGGNGGPVTVDQEDLPPGSIETALLGENEIHRWPFVITTTAVITVNIASEFDLDAVIMVEDPSGNIIAQQNDAQDGAPEILTDILLAEPGTYNILITGENDTTGYYAILVSDVLDTGYYTFVFNGTMDIGESKSANSRVNNDHFWHFLGTGGDVVTIRVTPGDNSDLFIYLYGPDGTILVDFHNETGEGEAEELLSFTLPDTGFYSILMGEYSFNAATYTISLTGG
jgi:hypothetical protein